jgi:SAM-dependent methyltransferase
MFKWLSSTTPPDANAESPAPSSDQRQGASDGPSGADVDPVHAAFWLFLGRQPSESERRLYERQFAGADRKAVVLAFVTSTEFAIRREAWLEGRTDGRDEAGIERRLRGLGAASSFVSMCYEFVLGRDVDPGGLAYYAGLLNGGTDRLAVVKALAGSDEFAEYYRRVCPQAGVVPRDGQLCELANPAKWDNPDWLKHMRAFKSLSAAKLGMHRKAYEFTQLFFGLDRLGKLATPGDVLSVGAGHEPPLFLFANCMRRVVATDLYEDRWTSERAMEGDPRVLTNSDEFAPFPYDRDRLVFLRMDGRRLAFATGVFDVVYSLSSIEHFGKDGARASMAEMGRVLRPGGVLAVATEWHVSGPPHAEVFSAAEIADLIAASSLRLVQPIDDRVYQRYEAVPVDIAHNPYQTPQMLVRDTGTVFTSVMMFLEKV